MTGRSLSSLLFVAGGAMVVATSLGCSGSKTVRSAGAAADTVASGCADPDNCPTRFSQLQSMTSDQLDALFNSGTAGDDIFSGVYAGLPLCFPSEIPSADQFPQGARAVPGFDLLIKAVQLLTTDQMNALAGFIWHGKKFTPRADNRPWMYDAAGNLLPVSQVLASQPDDYVYVGDVVNNIGRPDIDFSAEARLLLDRPNGSIDLDYEVAETGLQLPTGVTIPGISGISVDIIRHIWDRVVLVNADEKLYVGVAYVIDRPGVYDSTAVPICYFALTPQGMPAADVGALQTPSGDDK